MNIRKGREPGNEAQQIQYKIEKGSEDDEYAVAYSDHEHHVSLLRHRCSCSFSKVMGLPCRHLFAVRASQNLPVFELQLVTDRWRKDYQLLVVLHVIVMEKWRTMKQTMECHCQDLK